MKHRKQMRRMSKTTAAQEKECREVREQLRQETGHCEICGHDSTRVKWGQVAWAIHIHEIARGALRQRSLDKRFALLVVCFPCHEELGSRKEWPDARQLAVLKRQRPEDYDLRAFNRLIGRGPNRITEQDVEAYKT